ncbi:MAG: hypothetical protein ACKVX7_02935 [Planctomycetota bacterium]
MAIRPRLDGARVLACEYVPEDGQANYLIERAFWYENAPKDWDQVLRSLPSDTALERVGRASTTAPLTMADAERLLPAAR